jgi:hypothetical protein
MAMTTAIRQATGAATLLAVLTIFSGCVYHEPTTVPAATVPITVPSASPTTIVIPSAGTTHRVAYPDGAYELRGGGTATNPYYWVWVPREVQAPMLPPPPPLPPAR